MVRARARRSPSLVGGVAVSLAAGLLGGASPAAATMTLWPTCTAPPAGDYARCEHGAFPQSIIPGPDGALWFTTARADLGRVTPGGAFTQTPVPLGAGGAELLGGLTVGPDGALWFPAQFGSPYLYRATPTSPPVLTSTLNPGDTQPRDARLGPDGAIWLAEAKSNTLGRFVPGGGYASFPLPAKPAGTFVGPLNVADGPDGRLWVARPRDVVAMTPAGVATTYAIPGVQPSAVTAGPDGAVWVAAYGTDNVARIATTGAATVFPLPAGSGPGSITTGPDGALWVGLGKSAPGVMRLTSTGAWTVTPLLFSSQVSSITTGPDGAIWFGDLGGSRVGRLTTGPVPGPAVLALSPSAGPAGTVIHVTGVGLSRATGVTVGGARAAFRPVAGGLDVTAPAGSGAAPVLVSAGPRRSPPTAAATFSYATAAPAVTAPPPSSAAPTVTLGAVSLAADGTLSVAAHTTASVPFDLTAALPAAGVRGRITASAAASRLVIRRAGTAEGRFVRTGTTRLRLRLSAAARRVIARAGRRGTRLEVGVRLRLGGGQTSVGQRTYRVRKG